jgi:hypothetical protein
MGENYRSVIAISKSGAVMHLLGIWLLWSMKPRPNTIIDGNNRLLQQACEEDVLLDTS